MYSPMTTEGLGVLFETNTCMNAVSGNFADIMLRYGAGLGVPIVSEAWTCPSATSNLFDNSSSVVFD